MSCKSICLLLLFVVNISHCFYFGITQQPVCLHFLGTQNDAYTFTYQINAQNPDKIKIDITTQSGRHINTFRQPKITTVIQVNQSFTICFMATDKQYKSVSIDIWHDELNKIKKLASKSDIYNVFNALSSASQKLRQIAAQEKFQEQRQSIHAGIIMNNEDQIKKYGLFKIILIIILTIGQIVLFKNFFKSNTNPLSI